MKNLLLTLSALSALVMLASAQSQSLHIQVIGTTSTQAVLSYRAPDINPCSIAVSDSAAINQSTGAFVSVVHDVDRVLFPGADQDLRAGNLSNGAERTIVVGARAVGDASDGHTYSRALEANTTHYYTITCDGGSYTAKGSFTTQNVPLGNSAPDEIAYDRNTWGGWGWPTINYSDKSPNYIDPQTGVLIKRWTKPGDNGYIESAVAFSGRSDLAGSWTGPANIGATPDGQYATYRGSGGPSNALFLWGRLSFVRPSFLPVTWNLVDDIRIHLNGFGDQIADADRTVSVCLSPDYGQTCLGSSIDVVLPLNFGSDAAGPTSWPAPLFSGWGDAKVTPDMLMNNFAGTLASVSGSTVTWGGNSAYGYNNYFPVTSLKAGDAVLISGTDPICPQNLCTIASIGDEKTLSLGENVGTWTPMFTTLAAAANAGATSITVTAGNGFVLPLGGTYSLLLGSDMVSCQTLAGATFSNCSGVTVTHASGASIGQNQYFFPEFGFKIWKKTALGSISLDSAVTDWASSASMFTDYQGAGVPYCSSSTVTATYGADGLTPIPTLPGYLCSFNTNWGTSVLYFVAPSTGEARKLSNLVNLSVAFGPTPNQMYAYDNDAGSLEVCSYNASDATNGRFREWSDGYNTALVNPAFTCSNLSQTNVTVTQEIATAHPEIDQSYFGPPILESIEYPLFEFMLRPSQNAISWFCIVDVSQPSGAAQVVKCRNTWDTYPVRWLGSHGTEAFLTPDHTLMDTQVQLNNPGLAGVEQWSLNLLSVYNNGGSTGIASGFYDPQTCEGLGVTDSRWLAQGATGRDCVTVNVDGEPVARKAAQADLQPIGSFPVGARPAAWPHNSVACGGDGTTNNCWSYLQPVQEGDYLQDASQGSLDEKFLVAKKTVLANGTIDLVLAKNMDPFACRSSSSATDHAPGWTPIIWPPQSCGNMDFVSRVADPASASVPDNPQTYLGHTASWITAQAIERHITAYSWNLAQSLGGYGAGYGIRTGPFPAVVGQPFTFGVNGVYPFAGSNQGLSINQIQSHAGGMTYSAAPRESQWSVDGRPLGIANGGDQYLWNHMISKVAGFANVYQLSLPLDSANGSPIVFSGSDVSLDRKRRQVLAFAGYHLLRDISGPGSAISDSVPWSYCIADFAGECIAGSQQGSQYVSVPAASTTGVCSNDGTINAPCLATAGPHAAAYTQFDTGRPDPFGLRWRKLTQMFNGPGRTDNYANIHALATGDWGVSTVKWGDGRRTDIFGVKLPPWPNEDSIVRNNFVNVPISLGGQTGSFARIRFGYDTNLYCSSRQEQCSTAVANSDPYAWLSEPQAWTACGSNGCTINIPAISGRILYFVVDRVNAAGVISSGSTMITAVD